ncbi:hypothetical protein ABE073_04490 [Lederbergia citrisecunda]|uniref:hypothetical protein n=1 Tax=Lederbergia citrisecunda TaxID=2833583 RepID=UPI003D2DEF56
MEDKPYTFDRERIKRVAEELGVVVKFYSDNPGISNSVTGEHITWEELWKDWSGEMGSKIVDEEDA